MTEISAIEIEDEVDHHPVMVNHNRQTYILIGVENVDDYPTVGDYNPIPDE